MHRARHPDISTIQTVTVQPVHCFLGISFPIVPDKRKPSTLFRVPVSRDVDISDISVLLKQWFEILRTGPVGDIIHFETNHAARVGYPRHG